MKNRQWNSIPIYMMDFEGSATSGVVEFGVVRVSGSRIDRTETELCAPDGSIGDRERAVHGLAEGDVAGRAPFSSYFSKFVDYRRQGVFAAHNRHAENNFIKGTWAVPPVVPDWRRDAEGEAQEWGPWIDTVAIYKGVYPGLSSYALGELVEIFRLGEQLESLAQQHCPPSRCRAHCALYDALASALLLLRLEQEESLYGHLSVAWLLQFSKGHTPQRELF